MPVASSDRVSLDTLRRMKAGGQKIAMLTAYDFPTAQAAQAAGVHSLLIGDSMGTVLLGNSSTRRTPLSLMLTLGEAVRRAAPNVFLIGDMPYEAKAGGEAATLTAARRFREEAGCDAVKLELGSADAGLVAKLTEAGIDTIAHLGLLPQLVTSPDGYRPQARDAGSISIAALAAEARRMVAAGAVMVLLEAVPNEASQAVVAAVEVPVIGCGAGPACDGHVLVTQDMLRIGSIRPPRFVPVHANIGQLMQEAMRRYVEDIVAGRYPGPEHTYPLRSPNAAPTHGS
jgi:3-methyl-2-oxobutanoate hydroxymethyltransferase